MKADRHINDDHSIEDLQKHSEELAHEDHHGEPHPRSGCVPPYKIQELGFRAHLEHT